ncbi:MAG: GxxExxY protein, partial [Bacteroidia bacterium]
MTLAEAQSSRRNSMSENEISEFLLNLFIKIHSKIGPGLLESVYEEIICHELKNSEIPFTRQQSIPVIYEDIKLEIGFRTDIIIDNKVIIELKSVESLAPVHYKQVLTYLKVTNLKLGVLVNFNEELIKDGFH